MTDKRGTQFASTVGRQPSWDSVHALTDGMQNLNVRGNAPLATKPRRGSHSDSSNESAPVATPVPSKDMGSNGVDTSKAPGSHFNGASYQGQNVPAGYPFRGTNPPGGMGKSDEVLQVDYNLQPRHFISGVIAASPPSNASAPAPRATGPGAFTSPPPQSTLPNIPSAAPGLNGAPSMGGFYGQALPGAGYPGMPGAADNKAAQELAAQIALTNALQGLGAPLPGQPQNPALNPAALAAAAAAYGNPQMLPNLYGNPLYGATGGNPGAPPFYPGQENVAAAVANAVAALPPAAFHAALQHVGLGAYPLNPVPNPNQGGPSANNRKLGLYKTELCRSWEEKGSCRYGPKCQFAHGEEELKKVQRHPKYKTEICRTFWLSGSCPYGKRCCFIHTELPANGANEEKKEPVPEPRDRAQSTNSDTEQQQTSMLARIKRNEASSPSPPAPTVAPKQDLNGPSSSRPTPAALRVDTKSLEQTVPKNSYPYTSNPAMPAPGLSLATDIRAGKLSPVPATAGADFGRHNAARLEVVGVSPQSTQTQRPPQPGHLRSVSQTFASSAIEPTAGRASPAAGNIHTRSDSWGPNALIAPASAIDPPARYNDRKWS